MARKPLGHSRAIVWACFVVEIQWFVRVRVVRITEALSKLTEREVNLRGVPDATALRY